VATLWKRTGEPEAGGSTLKNVSDFDFASHPEHHPVPPDAASVCIESVRLPVEPRFKWRPPASVRRRRPQHGS
jgi:hypothetical protein